MIGDTLDQEVIDQLNASTEAALKADREASLRDMFACSAMAALIAKYSAGSDRTFIIKSAYEYADAMLTARKAGS